MRTIDIHAHIAPPQAVNLPEGGDWHGITSAENGGRKFLVVGPKRHWVHPSYAKTAEERIAEMDALWVDVHVLSTWTQLYNYELPLEAGAAACRTATTTLSIWYGPIPPASPVWRPSRCRTWPLPFRSWSVARPTG